MDVIMHWTRSLACDLVWYTTTYHGGTDYWALNGRCCVLYVDTRYQCLCFRSVASARRLVDMLQHECGTQTSINTVIKRVMVKETWFKEELVAVNTVTMVSPHERANIRVLCLCSTLEELSGTQSLARQMQVLYITEVTRQSVRDKASVAKKLYRQLLEIFVELDRAVPPSPLPLFSKVCVS